MATTSTWSSGASGNWNTTSAWTPSKLPGADSDVVINGSNLAPYTVTEDVSATIASLSVSDLTSNYDATLALANAATLTVTGLVTNAGTLVVSTGQALVAGSVFDDNFTSLQGGRLSGVIDEESLIQGFGTISGTLGGLGVVDAQGGTLDVAATLSNVGTGFEIENGAVLKIDQAVLFASDFSFQGATGQLDIASTFNGIIAGMRVGSSATTPTTSIDVHGSIVSGTLSGTTLTLTSSGGTQETVHLAHAYSSKTHVITQADGAGGTNVFFSSAAPCYVVGTRILTADGEKAVEDLREGDTVIVVGRDGQSRQPVKWIGRRCVELASHPRPDLAAPIRIRCDAIARGLPHRDLFVSPDHCLFVDGLLIPASLLINDMTIVQERDQARVHYFHVELERHAIMLAEGLPAESYLDTGNRAYFANAGVAVMLHPEFHINASLRSRQEDACAPLAVDAATVKPIWQRVANRAKQLGFVPRQVVTDADPELQVIAANRVLRPLTVAANRYVFVLPAGTRQVTLTSRATRPADIRSYVDDRRSLGVAIGNITLRLGEHVTVFPADHLPVGSGWHAVERSADSLWRWTNGAGVLLFDPLPVPAIMEIKVSGVADYIIEESPTALAV